VRAEDLVLADDRWAPVTSRIGFLRTPLDEVAAALLAWRRSIHGTADREDLPGGLSANVHRLEPLTGGVRPRELLVATASSDWTAVFDCGVGGGDQVTTVGYLARTIRTSGVCVASIPDRPASSERAPRYGSRQLEIFAPFATDFMNYTRTISVIRDGSRWRFDANGTVQDFEDTNAYSQRKIADRFSPQHLSDYATALGLRPWDLDFYPGSSVLITNPATPPDQAWVLTISETQRRIGITTG
jgi:hypothetical protein